MPNNENGHIFVPHTIQNWNDMLLVFVAIPYLSVTLLQKQGVQLSPMLTISEGTSSQLGP